MLSGSSVFPIWFITEHNWHIVGSTVGKCMSWALLEHPQKNYSKHNLLLRAQIYLEVVPCLWMEAS